MLNRMGLLDRWTKKTTTEQLSKADKKLAPVEKTDATAVTPPVVAGAGKGKSRNFLVIVRPLVTEKSARSESAGKYTFVVARWASKVQVRQAIKELYGIAPMAVNMVNVQGKRVRFGRTAGRRSDFKKAVITLPKGKTITIHEGV